MTVLWFSILPSKLAPNSSYIPKYGRTGTYFMTACFSLPDFCRRWFSIQKNQLVYQKKFKVCSTCFHKTNHKNNYIENPFLNSYYTLCLYVQGWKNSKDLFDLSSKPTIVVFSVSIFRSSPLWWWKTCACAQWNRMLNRREGSALKSSHPPSKCVFGDLFFWGVGLWWDYQVLLSL